MIDKDELNRIASYKGISPRFAELDYFQDIALFNIFREYGNSLAFKGGTCLYKVFQLNRFSEDLDFTARKGFKAKGFFERLPSFFEFLDIKSRAKVEQFQNSVNVLLEIEGIFFDGSPKSMTSLAFNISLREGTSLPVQRHSYKSHYQELRAFDLFVLDEKEILSEKIRAIYERNKPRDIYDLWFLLKQRKVQFDQKLTNEKISVKFNIKNFIVKVGEKKTGWERDLAALVMGELPSFEQVVKEIEELMA